MANSRASALNSARRPTVEDAGPEAGHRPDAPANFWAVFECAPDAYLLLAPDAPRYTMVAANEACLRATMTRREEIIGKPLFEAFPDNPADPGATGVRNLQASLSEVLQTRRPHRMAMQKHDIRSPNGDFEERYWEPLNSPVFDEHGDLIYIIHRVEDVTEQALSGARLKSLEGVLDKLRESEERYRLLADMIPQQIWTMDPSGYHTYFSRRWYEFTGSTPEETRGDGWLAFVHPDDRQRTLDRWKQSLQTGQRYSIEYRIRKRTGEYCWFWGQAIPQRNETGAIVRWVGTLTDISERRQLDEERERLFASERDARAQAERRREEVERITESRTRLMRGFTHDVKNPLGAADGYAQLLQDGILGELSDKQLDSIARIRRSIRTSLNLIQDLLELAKAEAGQLELQRVDVDAAELARDAAEDFRAQATAAGLALEIRTPAGLRVHTDPKRVRQILSNLLSNAVKYTQRGTIIVEGASQPDATQSGNDARIAIRITDTGPGIPEEKRETIFQEFTRLDANAQQGAGVGLAISRRIARLLGGDITLHSVEGRGSTFTLWLPCTSKTA